MTLLKTDYYPNVFFYSLIVIILGALGRKIYVR